MTNLLRSMYLYMIKWFLKLLLYIIPFQLFIFGVVESYHRGIATLISRLDEIAIVVFSALALVEFIRKWKLLNGVCFLVLFPIIAFGISGIISGITNGNSMLVTILAIFDYTKYFLIIFIYAAFFNDFEELKRVIRVLIIISIFLGLIALIQEIWALASVYIFEKSKADAGIYIFRSIWNPGIIEGDNFWRFGIYRAPSLMYHPNYLGLYSLLTLTLYIFLNNKLNYNAIIPQLISIFVGVSRMVFTGFSIIAVSRIYLGRRRIVIIFLPLAVGLFFMTFLADFNISKAFNIPVLENIEVNDSEGIPYRVYAMDKSLEIFKDHPILGVGPGMFGGVVSVIFNSHIYDEYNFQKTWVFNRVRGLDQFWPQVLAETGIVGIVSFVILIIFIFIILIMEKKQADSAEARNLLTGLIIFTLILVSFTIGSGLNITPVVVTFFAIFGVTLRIILMNDKNGRDIQKK